VTRFGLPDSTPPAIVEVEPYNGYIDPRMESSNGVDNDLGFSEVRIFFDEFVRNQGGGSLDASAFAVSVSGGSAPEVVGVETKGNPEVYVTLGSPIPAGERMTLTVAVEDMEGNATEHALVYASLPCDVDGSGRVQALDLLRFRQIFFGTFEPAEGTDEMAIDMDRSGVIQSVDLLRFRQLYAGTGNATQAWSGAELP
jgi:hypothetical protein